MQHQIRRPRDSPAVSIRASFKPVCETDPWVPGADDVLSGALAYGDISVCVRDDGSPWLLGTGAHGKVRLLTWSILYPADVQGAK